jgi:hypothetical protein
MIEYLWFLNDLQIILTLSGGLVGYLGLMYGFGRLLEKWVVDRNEKRLTRRP